MSQFELAAFQMLNSHMWLVATLQDSAVLDTVLGLEIQRGKILSLPSWSGGSSKKHGQADHYKIT